MLKGSHARRPPAKKSLSERCDDLELELVGYDPDAGKKHRLTVSTYTENDLLVDLCYVRQAFQERSHRKFSIYDALAQAYRVYWKWSTRGNLKEIVPRAAVFLEAKAEETEWYSVFRIIIELAVPAKNAQEQKNNFKYRERLRIAAEKKCSPEQFVAFTKKTGGINPPKAKTGR